MTHPCQNLAPTERSSRHRAHSAGFTLIDSLIALAIAGVLSLIAIPSFQHHLQRARRTDAMAAILQIQLAEARWRSSSDRYGSLAEIGAPSTSGGGFYALQSADELADGYSVVASATGAQASDAVCRVLKLSVSGADFARTSGADSTTSNDAAANRRCWML